MELVEKQEKNRIYHGLIGRRQSLFTVTKLENNSASVTKPEEQFS